MNLDADQLDALAEVVNIGVGRAAASLHELVDRHVRLTETEVSVCRIDQVDQTLGDGCLPHDVSVVQGFQGQIAGKALLAFPERSGATLAKLIGDSPEDDEALEADTAGVQEENGNIVLNRVLGSLANEFGENFHYTEPTLATGSVGEVIANHEVRGVAAGAPTCLLADAHFHVEETSGGGSLLLAFNTQQLAVLLDRLLDATPA